MTEKTKLTPEQKKKIQDQIAALQASLDDQDEAAPKDQAAADAEVAEQRAKTAALFDKLGITEEDWEVLAVAIGTGTEQRTRQIVREELAAEEETEEETPGSLKDAQDKGGNVPPVTPDSTPETPPGSKHWTEKKIFGKTEAEEEGPK